MSNKVALVTGCTRGLGRALVEALIAEGLTVVGCGRMLKLIEDLNEQYAPRHSFYPVDVADDDDVAKLAGIVLEEVGTPDLLINNAAIANEPVSLWEVSQSEFSRLIDTNIKGTFHTIRHFLPAMIERGSGMIINMSSEWGRSTSPHVVPYCTSKWGIEGLSQGLAQELPEGIGCVALNPGVINTDMLQGIWSEDAAPYPTAEVWVKQAVPYILSLNVGDNGKSLTVGER